MANENMDDWRLNTSVVLETVKATKMFLDGELAKCQSVDDLQRLNANIKPLFTPPIGKTAEAWWSSLKKDGVGQTTILKFLGKNWKQHTIQDALKIL